MHPTLLVPIPPKPLIFKWFCQIRILYHDATGQGKSLRSTSVRAKRMSTGHPAPPETPQIYLEIRLK